MADKRTIVYYTSYIKILPLTLEMYVANAFVLKLNLDHISPTSNLHVILLPMPKI